MLWWPPVQAGDDLTSQGQNKDGHKFRVTVLENGCCCVTDVTEGRALVADASLVK